MSMMRERRRHGRRQAGRARAFALLAVFMLACAGSAGTLQRPQPRPATASVKTNRAQKFPPSPAPALPRAGGKITDPIFGAEIMRVTEESDGKHGGTAYSYWPTFNRDNTRLLAQAENDSARAVFFAFDPQTFTLGAKQPPAKLPDGSYPKFEDAIWSGTDPDVLYCTGNLSPRLYEYNVTTRRYKLIADLGKRLARGDYLHQMSKSLDDDTFAFTRKNAAYRVSGYLVYRRSTDSILFQAAASTLDEVQIDKSGRFLVVKTGEQGAGKVEVKVKDLQTGTLTDLQDGAPDYAPGHSDNGTGTVVGADNWRAQLTARPLAAPRAVKTLLDLSHEKEYGGYHVSMLADDENWALLNFLTTANGVFRQELVQVATDGSGRVRRLLHHHSVFKDYYDSPRSNISRDGRFVAFTSNWGVGGGRRDLFVARIEPPRRTR
ncbi:MAG TPA: hypothetical protein VK388_18360 [Pyrinomonadaceae bacterium]|nr:hypothetical protein [Pyrinomonadaceae bacterium]